MKLYNDRTGLWFTREEFNLASVSTLSQGDNTCLEDKVERGHGVQV